MFLRRWFFIFRPYPHIDLRIGRILGDKNEFDGSIVALHIYSSFGSDQKRPDRIQVNFVGTDLYDKRFDLIVAKEFFV